MTEYEYLYIPAKSPESSFVPLCGKNLESLFVIHERVIEELQKADFMPLIRLKFQCIASRETRTIALKIRLEVESSDKKYEENPLMICDFEKLLSKGLRQMTSEEDYRFKVSEANCSVSAQLGVVGKAYAQMLKNNSRYCTYIQTLNQVLKENPNLTIASEECDSSPPMKETPRKKVANQSAKLSVPPVFQELRLSRPDDKDSGRLRDNLSKVIRSLSFLEEKTSGNGQLLSFATELNTTFVEFVAHWLRPDIEPIERSINERLVDFEPSTLPQKQEFAKTVNAELRSLGLAIRCPKTNRPSILVADPSSHPSNGRFQLQHKGIDDKPKRAFSTVNLKNVTLMPDISSFDIDLASILAKLAKIPSQRILTSATN